MLEGAEVASAAFEAVLCHRPQQLVVECGLGLLVRKVNILEDVGGELAESSTVLAAKLRQGVLVEGLQDNALL